jgi:hypothetical protein
VGGSGLGGVTGGDAGQSGAGASVNGGTGGDGGSGGLPTDGRRFPLPCQAPLPTGFCFVSDRDDVVGGGNDSQASGDASVQVVDTFAPGNYARLSLWNAGSGDKWTADFWAATGELLLPGLFDPATGNPVAGLTVYGDGPVCNQPTGKFAVEELKRSVTTGYERFSATFEQHCEGRPASLRGVINFNATGIPDWTLTPRQTITLEGSIFRVVYEPARNVGYGLDASYRRLAKIDLASGDAAYVDVAHEPNDACVNAERQRLFVVNKGSGLITEYDTNDLSRVRDIPWTGTDWGADETHFKIYCAPERVYVVDGAWAPGLFSIEGLDDAEPNVVDHSGAVAGVGGLALNAEGTALYYWYQEGWTAELTGTSVRRLETANLSEINASIDAGDFSRDPLDAPILLDEARGLVIAKNRVFDANDLRRLVDSIPNAPAAYALDPTRGRVATKDYIYEVDRFDVISQTMVAGAEQVFFDASGGIWYLSNGVLSKQVLEP